MNCDHRRKAGTAGTGRKETMADACAFCQDLSTYDWTLIIAQNEEMIMSITRNCLINLTTE